MDGKLDDPAWAAAPWTSEFVDIQGDAVKPPYFRTRAKMRWDEKWLYVGADLQDDALWANQTQHDDVVFLDNDFEVFIDPSGSCRHYLELEANVINTTWWLTLTKPYADGGQPINIGGEPQVRAAAWADGPFDDPLAGPARGWQVELALPLERYVANQSGIATAPPREGEKWRLDFSRVEWNVTKAGDCGGEPHQPASGGDSEVKGERGVRCHWSKVPDMPEHNWVWSEQGAINMHLPERWGFLQFTSKPPSEAQAQWRGDSVWGARQALAAVYYAQKQLQATVGYYARDIHTLVQAGLLPPQVMDGSLNTTVPAIQMPGYEPTGYAFNASVHLTDGPGGKVLPFQAWVGDDRHAWFDPPTLGVCGIEGCGARI